MLDSVILDRFVDKIEVREDGCWHWLGYRNRKGYGQAVVSGRPTFKISPAHRLAYEWMRGPIPEGLQIDHLCRVRHCVNPWHMETVTSRENQLRGFGPAGVNARKTYCIHGHEYTEENTFRYQDGRRACRTCTREQSRINQRRRRARLRSNL